MKLLLSGFEGSKRILHASSYLVQKYFVDHYADLGHEFEVQWLNYGDYKGQLDIGTYVKLAEHQDSVRQWSTDLVNHLKTLVDDTFVILALDDYLLSDGLDIERYEELLAMMQQQPRIVCARLCISDFYQPEEIKQKDGRIIVLSDRAEYSSTTQYCIWDRGFLMELLEAPQIETPWEFEVNGSRYLNRAASAQVIGHWDRPALQYNCSSSLSSRWKGINVSGCNSDDIEYLVTAGALDRKELTNRGTKIHWGTPTAIAEAM